MSNIKYRIQLKKSQLNKKISFALLGGAVALQSPELIKSWANLQNDNSAPTYENGNTALHVAVQNSWPEAAEILLTKGASLSSINYEDLSVITLARNIYDEYESKLSIAKSYDQEVALDEDTNAKFTQAKQVLDILDKYQYADNI